MSVNMNINIINQNCQGIKSNICYINSLPEHECNIMFVCERTARLKFDEKTSVFS